MALVKKNEENHAAANGAAEQHGAEGAHMSEQNTDDMLLVAILSLIHI